MASKKPSESVVLASRQHKSQGGSSKGKAVRVDNTGATAAGESRVTIPIQRRLRCLRRPAGACVARRASRRLCSLSSSLLPRLAPSLSPQNAHKRSERKAPEVRVSVDSSPRFRRSPTVCCRRRRRWLVFRFIGGCGVFGGGGGRGVWRGCGAGVEVRGPRGRGGCEPEPEPGAWGGRWCNLRHS